MTAAHVESEQNETVHSDEQPVDSPEGVSDPLPDGVVDIEAQVAQAGQAAPPSGSESSDAKSICAPALCVLWRCCARRCA